MNVLQAIRTKRAVRQFQDKSLPDEVIFTILEAGRRAQSAKNMQPWHFIAIRDKTILQALVDISPNAGHLSGAALGIAIVTPLPETKLTVMFDAGQAAAYMQLAGWELGVASCLGTIYDLERGRDLLGIPADRHLHIVISFGFPKDPAVLSRPLRKGGRRALEDITHWDKW